MSDEFDIEELLREVHDLLDDEAPQIHISAGDPADMDIPVTRQIHKRPITEERPAGVQHTVPDEADTIRRKPVKNSELGKNKASAKPQRKHEDRYASADGKTAKPHRSEKTSHMNEEKLAAENSSEAESGRVGRGRNILRSIPFFSALAIITVIAWMLPLRDTVSEREKRELEKFPVFSAEALSDGSYFAGIGTWFADGFTFRDTWMSLGDYVEGFYGKSSIALTGAIGHASAVPPVQNKTAETPPDPANTAAPLPADSEPDTTSASEQESEEKPDEEEEDHRLELSEVLEGKEYTATDTAIVMDGNVYPAPVFSEYYSDMYARHMSDAAELLDGKARVFTVLPLRCTAPMLSRSFRDYVGFIPEEDVISYMFSQMDERVYCVDTLTPLARHSDEYIYFHSDHHWTARGAYYAYEEWAKVAGFEPVPLDEYTEGMQEPYTGTYYHNNTPKNPVYEDQVYTYDPPGDIQLFIIDQGAKDSPSYRGYEQDVITKMFAPDKYCAFLTGDRPLCTLVNNDIEEESACLIIKDSNGNPFSYYFTQHYKYVYVMDYRYYTNRTLSDFVDTYGVNDVIFCTSMFLAQGEGCNSLLKYIIK